MKEPVKTRIVSWGQKIDGGGVDQNPMENRKTEVVRHAVADSAKEMA